MNLEALFKEKLDKILFLEVNIEVLNKIFNLNLKDDIYLPVQSFKIINGVISNNDLKEFNIGDFIEGMFYVMGCDPLFKFNSVYKLILKSNERNSKNVIKRAIYDRVQSDELFDAYLMLKGLSIIEESEDVYSKMLLISDGLRKKNAEFREEQIRVINNAQNLGLSLAYYYESTLFYDNYDYEKASLCLNKYFASGGCHNKEIDEYKEELEYRFNYKQGKEILFENPVEALKKLLLLAEKTSDDAVLYYYIAVAYRLITNYEKAIYYLNEALGIDNEFVDVVNELGLNYACLGDYISAIMYFKKAFEVSQAIEICTNIIMCYISINNIEEAKEYFEIGKKLSPEDEILIELREKLEGEGQWN